MAPKEAGWSHFCLAGTSSRIGFEPPRAVRLLCQQFAPCQTPWGLADRSAPTSTEIRSNLPRGEMTHSFWWRMLAGSGCTQAALPTAASSSCLPTARHRTPPARRKLLGKLLSSVPAPEHTQLGWCPPPSGSRHELWVN